MADHLNPEIEPTRRVAITGLGVIAPNGFDLAAFWRSIRDGRSAVGPVTRFDVSAVPHKLAAEVRDFQPALYFDGRKAKRFERAIQYELAAARLAVNDAGLELNRVDPERVGIVDGTTIGGMESTLKAHVAFLERGYRGMSPFTFLNAYAGGGSGEVALELGIRGHAITYCSGSASGNDAIGHALAMIQQDEVDIMLAGASEAPLIEAFWSGFSVTRVMTQRNDDPARAMRPFDRTHDGFVMGEGAAFLILEELTHAVARQARIYAELLAHGRSCEAYHSVQPHPEGLGVGRAMSKALRTARLHTEEIDYINAHGTATPVNDLAESVAIKRLFGPAAARVAVSSTKPVTGHLLGAAGALETVVTALAIHHQHIPLTLNLAEPAAGCDLDYVIGQSRAYPIRAALNLNSGFGGKNSCLVMRRWEQSA